MKLEFDKCFGVQEAQLPVDKTKDVHHNIIEALKDEELFPKGEIILGDMEPGKYIPGKHNEDSIVCFKIINGKNMPAPAIDFFGNDEAESVYLTSLSKKQCSWLMVKAFPDFKKIEIGYY